MRNRRLRRSALWLLLAAALVAAALWLRPAEEPAIGVQTGRQPAARSPVVKQAALVAVVIAASQPAVPDAKVKPVVASALILVGTNISPAGSLAILSDGTGQQTWTMRLGDHLGGWKVASVTSDAVLLEAADHFERVVYKPIQRTPVALVPPTETRSAETVQAAAANILTTNLPPAPPQPDGPYDDENVGHHGK